MIKSYWAETGHILSRVLNMILNLKWNEIIRFWELVYRTSINICISVQFGSLWVGEIGGSGGGGGLKLMYFIISILAKKQDCLPFSKNLRLSSICQNNLPTNVGCLLILVLLYSCKVTWLTLYIYKLGWAEPHSRFPLSFTLISP